MLSEQNQISVYETQSGSVHPWSVNNRIPKSVANSHRSLTNIAQLTQDCFVLLASYGWALLDLNKPIDESEPIKFEHLD